jgi:hypothetical protein
MFGLLITGRRIPMRPIDADALISDIESARNMLFHSPYERRFHEDRIEFALNMVEDVPTIDYVPRQQWISVKDRLPEDCIDQSKDIKNIKVLVAIKAKNGWTVRTQNRCKNTHYRYFGADPEISWYWRHSAGDVTHWMPLPEPPKEDSK